MASYAAEYPVTTDHAKEPSPFRRLYGMVRQERRTLWTAVIYSIAIALLTLALPIATQAIVNTIAFGNLFQPLLVLTLAVAIVSVLSSILQMFRFHIVEMLQRRVFVRIASDSVNRLLRARVDELQMRNGPEVVNRFLEVVGLQKAAATLLVDGLSVGMQTLAGMLLLGLYHPWLLAFDAILLVASLVLIFPFGIGATATAIGESKAKYALVAWLEELARNSRTFRGQVEAQWAFAKTDELVTHYLDYRSQHFRILLRQFGGSLGVQALAGAALLGVGGLLVIQRQLTLGQLVAAELVVSAVLVGIAKLAKHLESYYDLLASVDKLGMLTDLPMERDGTEIPQSLAAPMEIRVRNESFDILLKSGDRFGIDGVSGSGKSLLTDAMLGLRDPVGWNIEMDGHNIRQFRLAELRSTVQLVRGTEIFHGTILENVRVGRQHIPVSLIEDTLRQFGIWDSIQKLPNGLDTQLATGGAPLSEGQAQVLMIARAVVGAPRLLILDETLDHLMDAVEREVLMDALFAPERPWTLAVVTSRADVQARCNRIVTMPDGTIREVRR
ncbi:MAG: ATP-binding cassette domain-containing protein [Bryobacteraceae bacterium]